MTQATDGHGLDSQEHRCRTFAEQKGLEIVEVFRDSYTGGGDFWNRPAMRELLEYVDAHPTECFTVIFDDLKRFARDTQFHWKLRAEFNTRGIKPECLNFNFEDTPEGGFIETIMAAQGELERKQNKRQVIQKMAARLNAGYWPFGSKKGYTIVKDPAHGKICRPNSEGKILAEALEEFASRVLVRRVDVCRVLVEKGFWRNQSPDRYIDKLTEIMRDPFYCGDIEYPVWQVQRREGKHEGIISRETYARIQKLITRENSLKRIRQDVSPDFPLRGLLVCDYCGNRLTAAWTNRKFPYYVCHNKKCPHYGASLRKADVESRFMELLRKSSLKTEIDVLVRLVFERTWNKEIFAVETEQAEKARQRLELEIKASRLTELVLASRSDDIKRVYEAQIDQVAKELTTLSTSAETVDLSIPYRTALDKAIELLKNPYMVWQNMNVLEQHRLFYFIFDEKLAYHHFDGYRTEKISTAARLFEEYAVENTQDVEMAGVEPACKGRTDRCSTSVVSVS